VKSVKKLGRKVKTKYPEYGHLSDREAGELVLQEHPEYADYIGPSDLDSVLKIQSIYSPDNGVMSSWWQGKKSASRTKLLDALNGEVQRILTGLDQRIEYQKKQYDLAVAHALHVNQLLVIKRANKFGVSPGVYERIILKTFEAKFSADLDRHKMELELERAERMVEIEVRKEKILKDNEADREVRLTLLAQIQEAMKRYYDLKGLGADKNEVNYAKAHWKRLEKQWASMQNVSSAKS
jgi:hypothetical protein